ncbi:accessory gene regulator B family protein [Paramaledivibacter caminithermalis]|jgi:accessory gene regulator B|uniref:Accessory gene regulator B n=1 Tax=Paramaledivibacter caminithermalis (strain DSM 15212 / CIP 107654 / DViRD3) TaxID=1121301 RepID=A0A1M6LDC1_PARC5|nr:accessory gene regulator B family protein [Paramaledivibacter caminithermalis]SHJ69194.1 Accessory gene regulator B [Paramaledivibacter caminithermalis DSM 15212]
MIHNIAVKLGKYMALISESDREREEILIYSVEILMNYLIWIVSLFVISMLLNILIPKLAAFSSVVVYTVTFIFIRRYFGGYHTKNSMICLMLSIVVPMIALFVRYHIDFNIFLLLLVYMISYIIGIKIGTIDNINKRLSKEEKSYFKTNGLKAIKIIFTINIIIYLFGFQEISDMMTLATIFGFVNLLFGT